MPTVRPDQRRYRGAIIGLGNVARSAHLPGLLRNPSPGARIEIVGAVDPALPDAAGLPVVPDLEAIERLGPIDFVDICTHTASHLDLVLWALDRGLHVICEKPVAIHAADARRIAEVAKHHGRVVMPCHQYRFNPAWRQVRRWLDEGAIGAWSLAEFHVYRLHADRGTDPAAVPWRGRRQDSLGGVLLDHGTHLIYQLLDVAGVPSTVHGWTANLRHHDYDVEDTAQLVLTFPDRLAVLFLTWAARHRETRIRFVGERGTIAWEGGLLHLTRSGTTETLDFTAALDKAAYPNWFADLFEGFVTAMDQRDGAAYLEDILRVAEVLEAARPPQGEAAGHRQPLNRPRRAPTPTPPPAAP
jgi:predicted dehydrogenase